MGRGKLIPRVCLQLYFILFIYFFELEQHGMCDRKKDAVSFFFIKETANVCPSLHPYCIDWFYIR